HLLEMVTFLLFLASITAWIEPGVPWGRTILLLVIVPATGLAILLVMDAAHLVLSFSAAWEAPVAAVLALVIGFVLRHGAVTAPAAVLAPRPDGGPPAAFAAGAKSQPPGLIRISPEDGRPPGGGPGADPLNRPAELRPRSKVFGEE